MDTKPDIRDVVFYATEVTKELIKEQSIAMQIPDDELIIPHVGYEFLHLNVACVAFPCHCKVWFWIKHDPLYVSKCDCCIGLHPCLVVHQQHRVGPIHDPGHAAAPASL